jgi:hypothetical protein
MTKFRAIDCAVKTKFRQAGSRGRDSDCFAVKFHCKNPRAEEKIRMRLDKCILRAFDVALHKIEPGWRWKLAVQINVGESFNNRVGTSSVCRLSHYMARIGARTQDERSMAVTLTRESVHDANVYAARGNRREPVRQFPDQARRSFNQDN